MRPKAQKTDKNCAFRINGICDCGREIGEKLKAETWRGDGACRYDRESCQVLRRARRIDMEQIRIVAGMVWVLSASS